MGWVEEHPHRSRDRTTKTRFTHSVEMEESIRYLKYNGRNGYIGQRKQYVQKCSSTKYPGACGYYEKTKTMNSSNREGYQFKCLENIFNKRVKNIFEPKGDIKKHTEYQIDWTTKESPLAV